MTPNLALHRCWCSNLLTGNQIKQLLQAWLSPADPSTNHNIARKASHEGTAVWFFEGKIVIEWKHTGSLLWIHGKRAFLSAIFALTPSDRSLILVAGSGKSVIWSVGSPLLSVGTYSPSAPPSFKTLWMNATLDQPLWPISTSISRTSTSKAVTTCCALLYFSFPLALVLAVTFSTGFTRHTKMAPNSRVTTP